MSCQPKWIIWSSAQERTVQSHSASNQTVSFSRNLMEQNVKLLTRHMQVMQGLSVMLGMWRTSPSFSQLASVPVKDMKK